MLIIRSAGVLARVDPAHGGEVLDLVDLTTGRQLLGRLPFGSADRQVGPVDDVQMDRGLARWLAGLPPQSGQRLRSRRSPAWFPRHGLARAMGGAGCR